MCVLNSSTLRFLSGGEDGTIQLWSLAYSAGSFTAQSRALGIRHTQQIRCVAYDSVKSQVLSCYSRSISIAHLEAPKTPTPIVLSADAQQCHVHPQNPAVIILEVSSQRNRRMVASSHRNARLQVDHRDRQIQVYDTRKSSFRDAPCIEFGRPFYGADATSFARKRTYRFFRGSTLHSLFARGYQDGTVCVWDYRNAQVCGSLMDLISRARLTVLFPQRLRSSGSDENVKIRLSTLSYSTARPWPHTVDTRSHFGASTTPQINEYRGNRTVLDPEGWYDNSRV